jgi:RNA polymerase sigma-70 factor, ECF subfamily
MTQDATLAAKAIPEAATAASEALPCDLARAFAEHGDYVWNTLRRLGVAQSELEDLTHDTFVALLRAWDDYDPARPLRPWLFVFAMRAASDHRRLARHRVEVREDADARDSTPDAAALLERKEREALAHAALQSVMLSRRAVFVLHELDGATIPEIATALEIPVATAYSRLRLAREDFAAAVKRLTARTR